MCPEGSHLSRPRMLSLKKSTGVAPASQQLLPHWRYQGTSVQPVGRGHPADWAGAILLCTYFSCVSLQLVSTVAPTGKGSELLQMAEELAQKQSLPQALQNACGPSWRNPPFPSRSPTHFQSWPCRHLVLALRQLKQNQLVNMSSGCLYTEHSATSSSFPKPPAQLAAMIQVDISYTLSQQ